MVNIVEYDHDNYPFTCQNCGAKLKLKASLDRHVRMIHDGGLYKCQNCDLKYTTRKELRIHTKAIHKNFLCDTCEFKTSMPCLLKIHKNSKHLGIKYPCNICGLIFS